MSKLAVPFSSLCLAASLMGSSPAAADGEWAFSLQVEPMYMAVEGYDPEVLAVFDIDGPGGEETPFEVSDIDFDGDFAFRGEASARHGLWGVGATGFRFDANGSSSNFGNSARFPDDDTYFMDASGYGIRVIDSACCNENETVAFAADAGLEVWSVDLYGIRTLLATDVTDLRLLFGVSLGELDTAADSKLTWTFPSGSGFNVLFSTRSDLDVLAGPLLALAADHQWGRFRFEGLLSQSVLFGDADLKSAAASQGFDTEGMSPIDVLQTISSDRTAVIPVTNIRLKAMFDLTDYISIGAGFFTSIWWNADTAPNLRPRDYTDTFESALLVDEKVANLRGNERSDLFFLGGLGAVEIRFFGP